MALVAPAGEPSRPVRSASQFKGGAVSRGTVLHRGLRRPVGLLVHTRITPDMLTTLRLLTGLLAAACFVHAGRSMAAGAGRFLLSALLDRADGELARQSRRFSRIGPRFDLTADCIATMSIFIGLGVGIGVGSQAPLLPRVHLELGPSAALSVAAIFLLLRPLQASTKRPPGGAASPPFDPDDVMLLLPPVIWFGGAGWIVLASGIVAPLAALVIGILTLVRRDPASARLGMAPPPAARRCAARSRAP